ncbi:MAG: histidine phosphatase family protein, partial [Oscillospiraceae bacterium]|nr:histidine phosphatase family protein [Oscillospiraceae bacterium]
MPVEIIPGPAAGPPQYAVIAARYGRNWVFVRHRDRTTWEIPGGHIEAGENAAQAAARELYEETGAAGFDLFEVGPYSVRRNGADSAGVLFFAQIRRLGALPAGFEIAERQLAPALPEALTYPDIQPRLFSHTLKWLSQTATTVYFIRHAKPDLSVRDDASRPLTPQGRAAAQNLVSVLDGVGIDGVYSSPYTRTVDTVKPLANHLGLRVTEVGGLRERGMGGIWVDDFTDFSKRQWADFDYRLKGGDSLRDTQARNVAALQGLL